MLGRSIGTVVDLSVTWLLPHQLQRMHETEAVGKSYDYGESSSLRIELGSNRIVRNIGCYLGRRGYANFDGSPVALKEVNALNRKVSSADQKKALAYFHQKTVEVRVLINGWRKLSEIIIFGRKYQENWQALP